MKVTNEANDAISKGKDHQGMLLSLYKNENFFDLSKLKAIADAKMKLTEKLKIVQGTAENI